MGLFVCAAVLAAWERGQSALVLL